MIADPAVMGREARERVVHPAVKPVARAVVALPKDAGIFVMIADPAVAAADPTGGMTGLSTGTVRRKRRCRNSKCW